MRGWRGRGSERWERETGDENGTAETGKYLKKRYNDKR